MADLNTATETAKLDKYMPCQQLPPGYCDGMNVVRAKFKDGGSPKSIQQAGVIFPEEPNEP